MPLHWAEAIDFEVVIRRACALESDAMLDDKIILLPLPNAALAYPPPPPLAA